MSWQVIQGGKYVRQMTPQIRQFVFAILLAALPCFAETGYVNVIVEDPHHQPVRLVEIGLEKGASKLTKDDGKAQLPLAQNVKADDWISFQLVHSPPGKDLAIVSPWDNRIPVPSFADNPQNLIRIVVVQRGDRAALESGTILASLAAKINKANAPKTANPQDPQPDPKEALLTVAGQYGLNAEDIDTAIRAWGAKTTDPYEAGLAALYERNYPKATSALQNSLQQREQKLDADQKAIIQDQKNIADAAFFLGQSLYEQGRYRQSAEAYQKCLTYRPDDPLVLNNLGNSLHREGSYSDAEPLFRHALAIDEKTLGPDHPSVARDLNNLAALLQAKGDNAAADPLYRRALAIDENVFAADDPNAADLNHHLAEVAIDLNNLAMLLRAEGKLSDAEPLLRRALDIDENILGPQDPNVAAASLNLAGLLQDQGEFDDAEALYRRALAIDEKARGPDHPDVARDLSNLAALLLDKGDLTQAEPLFRRALAIDEKALGSEDPSVAKRLNNLALLLQDKGDLAEAEPLYRRALAIDEKALGSDDPGVAIDLSNLARLLRAKGALEEAEPLLRRAVTIDETALGPDHPIVAKRLNSLAMILQDKNNLPAAEAMYRRALAIDEKALGPDDPTTKAIRKNLTNLQNDTPTTHH